MESLERFTLETSDLQNGLAGKSLGVLDSQGTEDGLQADMGGRTSGQGLEGTNPTLQNSPWSRPLLSASLPLISVPIRSSSEGILSSRSQALAFPNHEPIS